MDGQIKCTQYEVVKAGKILQHTTSRRIERTVTHTSVGTNAFGKTLLHKTCMIVRMYSGSRAHGNHACMHLCVLFTHMCQFWCVCICMCVCWLPNEKSRKRKRQDGWRGCLFIHYPETLVVSGGHGNTCPGPFSTGLFMALPFLISKRIEMRNEQILSSLAFFF